MNFSYENQGHTTYLTYEIQPNEQIDTMSLGMITNNKIQGLASTIYTQIDNAKFIKYNVSAKISARQLFSGLVTRKHLLGVLDGVISAILSAEDYMIDVNSIVLDLDYIFVDVSNCDTILICLPITKNSFELTDLKTFFKNIIFTSQFDQTENCDYVAKIFNYFNGTSIFSLNDFKDLINSIKNESLQNQSSDYIDNKQVKNNVSSTLDNNGSNSTSGKYTVIEAKKSDNVNDYPIQSSVSLTQAQVAGQQDQAKSSSFSYKQSALVKQVVTPVITKDNTHTQKKKESFFNKILHRSDDSNVKKKDKVTTSRTSKSSIPQNQSFAIPGQQAPIQGISNNFAIPGKTVPSSNSAAPMVQKAAYQPIVATQPTPIPQSKPEQQVVPQPVNAQPVIPQQVVPQGQPMNFGETVVLNNGKFGETTVLNGTAVLEETAPQPFLFRKKNNEQIALNKPVFRIGKERSYVDYFVSDNTAVSRSHANIITRDAKYFIVDTNSTNHTYVNGAMIQSNMETQLNSGDKIRLANEEFEFKLI